MSTFQTLNNQNCLKEDVSKVKVGKVELHHHERALRGRVGSSLWVVGRRVPRLQGGCSEVKGWIEVRAWGMLHPGCCHVSSWLEVNTIVNQCPLGIKLKVRQLFWVQALPDSTIYSFTTYMCATWAIHFPPLLFYFHDNACLHFKHWIIWNY